MERVLLLFALAVATPLVAAEPQGDLGTATSARSFAELFLEGRYEALNERMSAEMRAAFPRAAAEQVRTAMQSQNGAVRRLGQPWAEDTVEGYRRFRVPVVFERGFLDLRVVFDTAGQVAGFFQLPHVTPPNTIDAGASAKDDPDGKTLEFWGHWEGAVEIPGAPLSVAIDLGREEGTWWGTFDSPMQGARGLPLVIARVAPTEIEFAIRDVPGDPTFRGRLEAGAIRGTFTQSGQSFPFRLGREKLAPPPRPQEPKPPFPYESREVTFKSGEIELAGTLTLPPGKGPFPAALLISGSGAQNRDEEVFGHRPFLVLSDHLTRAGIAVLRADDRGVGGSGGNLAETIATELAADALAGVRYLRGVAGIDPKRVGLIGHSEGGVIAPLAASRSDEVAFIVLLAGTGVPGDQILARQMELIARAGGMGDEQLARVLSEQRKLLDLVATGADAKLIQKQLARLVEAETSGTATSVATAKSEAWAAQGLSQVTSRWFRDVLTHDPRVALRRVRVPVLALFGELDLQVPPAQSRPEIERALEQAGNRDVTIRVLPGLNHLFQQATTGAPSEYGAIEETMSPAVLRAVTEWIVARFSGRDPALTPGRSPVDRSSSD